MKLINSKLFSIISFFSKQNSFQFYHFSTSNQIHIIEKYIFSTFLFFTPYHFLSYTFACPLPSEGLDKNIKNDKNVEE